VTEPRLLPAAASNSGDDPAAAGSLDRPLPARPGRVGVVVADSHPLYLEALERNVRAWPEFELVGAAEGPAVLELVAATKPDVVVVDHTTIGVDRAELLEHICRHSRVLLICTDPEPAEVYSALAGGASGYLAKDSPKHELCRAIAALARGSEIIGSSVQPALASEIRLRETAPRDFLTDREREILLLMCDGLTAPSIARRLCIGLSTVKTHQSHLFEKLGATERAMAVARAFRRHLIE
jgi:two-component system, NarL family, nitrate/nitrite response regulator NarL